MNIILASKSPRRTEILSMLNIPHQIIPSEEDEIIDEKLSPIEVVKSLAYQKAKSIFRNHQDAVVIGSDTIVVINDEILGKPKDEQDAIRMLSLLQNTHHQVITGVSIISKEKTDTFAEISNVYFKPMSIDDIKEYMEKDNVYDKAGAYAIQSPHATFVEKIDGDFYNIMGLPKDALKMHLDKFLK